MSATTEEQQTANVTLTKEIRGISGFPPSMWCCTEAYVNAGYASADMAMCMNLFGDVRTAMLELSPYQYRWTFGSGVLRPEVAEIIEWETSDSLMMETVCLQKSLNELDEEWAKPFHGPRLLPYAPNPLLFARYGAMSVRLPCGILSQAYEYGWPTSLIQMTPAEESSSCMVIAVDMRHTLFEDLPLDFGRVVASIPADVRPNIEVKVKKTGSIFAVPPSSAKARNRVLGL